MKNDKNVKNKISLKTTLSKKNLKPLKPERINIQTIIKPKNNSYHLNKQNKIKKLFESKVVNLKNISKDSSFNSNNNSTLSKNKKLFISNSLNNSIKSTYTAKKRKYKKNKKLKNGKNFFINNHKNNLSNSIDSINNSSIHSSNINNLNNNKINNFFRYSTSFSISNNSKNKNNNYSNYSSSSKYRSNNDYSDSSASSYNSLKKYKKNIYYSKMVWEENELDNLTRKEVGIISSDDEDNNGNIEENNDKFYNNNNNSTTNNTMKENYNDEIERILIDIYNKNISIINSQNLGSPVSKKLFETSSTDKKKLKKIFKNQSAEKNLIVLKILSDKIKCLIEKCKEKIYEMDDIKKLYEQYMRENNNQRICNSIGSSGLTTNSNSFSYYQSDDDNYYIRNSLLLNSIQDEEFCKDISQDLLTQLINIKNTLKISSKEIENIFKYALNVLKTNEGKRAKFSIELIQLEQFNKIILNDDLISTLLMQIKFVFSKYKEDYIVKIIEQLQQECLLHKNSMTKFDNLLCQNIGITDENEKNNVINENNLLNEEIIENEDNNEINDNQDSKNNLINLEKNNLNNEDNNEENNNINENTNINNEEKNENENVIIEKNKEDEKNEEEENNNKILDFKNIDDLVKFINEDSEDEQKNSNKKNKKKNKKRKKKKNSVLIEEEKNNTINYKSINNSSINEYINNEYDDEIIKKFKEDLIKYSIYNYNITKIKPKLPINYLLDKFSD